MIFEGAKTEPNILDNIKKYFLNEKKEVVVKAIFGTIRPTYIEKA